MSDDNLLERAKSLRHYLANKAEWQDESAIVGELISEVERLRSENKIISDRAAHHEKQDAAEIELLAARIKGERRMNAEIYISNCHIVINFGMNATTDMGSSKEETGFQLSDETKEKIGMVILNSLKADKSRESQP